MRTQTAQTVLGTQIQNGSKQ